MSSWIWKAILISVVVCAHTTSAQIYRFARPLPISPPGPPTLRQLTLNSGYIFSGTVIAVKPIVAQDPHSVSTVQITFRVEQGIRASRKGQILAIREWAGLWNSGERYTVGERVLLFLYRPSKLGLTSPVGGAAGRFPLQSDGQIVLNDLLTTVLSTDPVIEPIIRGHVRLDPRLILPRIRRVVEE